MTLRNLAEACGFSGRHSERESCDDAVVLAFALDSNYLECMKVMFASMIENGAFYDAEIVIYTDDDRMALDPVVKLAANRLVVISGEKKNKIYSLAKDNVKRPERADWNKGTFLKWCVFEEQKAENLIFLDVDMLVLSPFDEILSYDIGKSIITVPQFQKELKDGRLFESLKTMLDGKFDGRHVSRINSGVMLVRSEYLSESFFDQVTDFATSRLDLHEQGHLSAYFKNKKNKISMCSVKYNFQESFLHSLEREEQEEIVPQIKILHYAGGQKPWKVSPDRAKKIPTLSIWHDYREKAKKLFGEFF